MEPFIVAQFLVLYTTIIDYPRIANHAALQMFVALFVISVVTTTLLRGRSLSYVHVASSLRGVAVVVYFYVGFHKLNSGFLEPTTSCANWYHAKLFRSAFNYSGPVQDVLPTILYEWSPWIVVVTELLTFVLLLVKRTRLLGVCTAIPLHLYVSLSGFVDFSSMMHSIMFLFLPGFVADSASVRKSLSAYHVGAVGIAVVTFYMAEQWSSGIGVVRTFQGITYDLAVIVVAVAIGLAIRRETLSVARKRHDAGTRRRPGNNGVRVQYGIFPAIVFVWGALPYVGLSSYGSLTMFSNIVTAPEYSNHLIVETRATDLFGFQDDLVQVIDMDRSLARKFRHSPIGDLVARSEVGYHVWQTRRERDEPLMAFLLEHGEPTFYGDLRESEYANWSFFSRWLFFREVDPVGEAQCRW